MPRKSLQAGYCSYPDAYCALEETECLSGTDTFSSSRHMQSAAGAHGGSCLLQEAVKEFVLGKCGEDGPCSPNAASCDSSSALSSYVKDTIHNATCDIGSTKFGKCGDRCSWSPQDCDEGEQWTFPENECTCDMVRVGGCVKDGFTYCSVSNLACDDASVWFGPTAVTAETGNLCYVCRQPTTDDDGVDGNSGGGGGTTNQNGGAGGTNGGGAEETDDDRVGGNYVGGMKDSPKNKSSTGAIVGGSLAGVAGAAAIIAAFVLVKRKRSKNKEVERTEAPVTVPSTDDNNEDISVL